MNRVCKKYEESVSRYSQWKQSNPRKAKAVTVMRGASAVGAILMFPPFAPLVLFSVLAREADQQQEAEEEEYVAVLEEDTLTSLCPVI